jgi:hypothetical protein
MKPRVLVACEYSGRVRDEFAARGWDAWSCDFEPSDTVGQSNPQWPEQTRSQSNPLEGAFQDLSRHRPRHGRSMGFRSLHSIQPSNALLDPSRLQQSTSESIHHILYTSQSVEGLKKLSPLRGGVSPPKA